MNQNLPEGIITRQRLANKFDYTFDAIGFAAKQVIEQAGKDTLWCFYGEMGAGKTSLIKEIVHQLGSGDEVSSPTFSLVNEYRLASGKSIFHFDFYRIKSLNEVFDIGYEDYFFSENICLIEWPEKIEEILENESVYKIQISKTIKVDERNINLSHFIFEAGI